MKKIVSLFLLAAMLMTSMTAVAENDSKVWNLDVFINQPQRDNRSCLQHSVTLDDMEAYGIIELNRGNDINFLIPTASNSSSSSKAALDPSSVDMCETPSGFTYVYNNIAVDLFVESKVPGIDAEVKKSFHLTYSETASATIGYPTYWAEFGFVLVFYCDDIYTRANKMEFVYNFADELHDEYAEASIIAIVAQIYAMSVGADVEEMAAVGSNCLLFTLGTKTNYENDLFSMTYKIDEGLTIITFERK